MASSDTATYEQLYQRDLAQSRALPIKPSPTHTGDTENMSEDIMQAELIREQLHTRQLLDQEESVHTTSVAPTQQKEKHHIDPIEAFFMIFIAFVIDCVQGFFGLLIGIPVLGIVLGGVGFVINLGISILAGLFFLLWFWMKGMSFSQKKGTRVLVSIGCGTLIELVANWIPAWTLSVALSIAADYASSTIKTHPTTTKK